MSVSDYYIKNYETAAVVKDGLHKNIQMNIDSQHTKFILIVYMLMILHFK
jgi:hypothetical protein